MKHKINIAIDGPSGSGKSSTAKKLAEELNMNYLDTGAMYRAVTYWFLNDLDSDEQELIAKIADLQLTVDHIDGRQITKVDEFDPGDKLYSGKVNNAVSLVASIKEVRDFLQKIQKDIAKDKNYIMDGRDIATVIMPDAELKIYLHAPLETRAKRRLLDLDKKGISANFNDVLENLRYRDEVDSNREHSPLIKHQDATVINTDNFTFDEQVAQIKKFAIESLYENK